MSKKNKFRPRKEPAKKPAPTFAEEEVADAVNILYEVDVNTLSAIERSDLWNACGAFLARVKPLRKEVASDDKAKG